MRRAVIYLKEVGIVLLAAICALFAFLLTRLPVFAKGEGYEVYYTASSSGLSSRGSYLQKLVSATAGESVRYAGDKVEEIATGFHAELLFAEEACGVENFYFYSPELGDAVMINGKPVNLHIAYGGEQTAVGTPIIFGGF